VLSFDDFYRQEFPAMVLLASTLVGGSAEDVAQEAMIRAHDRWDTVSAYDNPGTWVRRVTINLATSRLRRRATRIRKASRLLDGIPTVTWETRLDDDLLDALATLPRKQRTAVVLHYLEDRSVKQIADILNCAPSTAKVHLHRGRQALAQRLGAETEEIS
jgi:RNA polymerase sigma-70 factor (ECF subfamily)